MANREASFILKLIDRVSAPLVKLGQVGNSVYQSMAAKQKLFEEGGGKVTTTIGQLQTKIQQLTQTRAGLINENDIRRTNAEIRKLQAELNRLETLPPKGFFANLSTMSTKMGAIAGLALGAFSFAGATNLAQQVLTIGSNMEQTRISYRVMIGDAEKATKKIAELQKFADVSPFSTNEVLNAGESLLGFGVKAENLLPTMNKLGDISKGNAAKFQSIVDNYGKLTSAQRANTVDMNQFAIAGVPVWAELEKIVGKSGNALRKYVEDNGVSVATIDQIFDNLTKKGGQFYGMMAEQSLSTAGRWSTFVAGVEGLAVKIFDKLQPMINGFIDFGGRVMPYVERSMRKVYNLVVSGNKWFQEHKTLVQSAGIFIVGLGAAYLGYYAILNAGKAAMALHQAYTITMAVLTGQLTLAQIGLNIAMLTNPVFLTIAAIAALAAAVYYCWNEFEEFRGVMTGAWEFIKLFFNNMINGAKNVFEGITMMWRGVKKILSGDVKAGLNDIFEGYKKGAMGMLDVIPLTSAIKNGKQLADSVMKGYDDGVKDFKLEKGTKNKSNKDGKQSIMQTLTESMSPSAPASSTGSKKAASVEGDSGRSRIVNMRIEKIEVNTKVVNSMDIGVDEIETIIADAIVGGARDAETILSNG